MCITCEITLLVNTIVMINCVCSCMKVFVAWCCGGLDKRTVKNELVLEHILLDWRIWHRAEEEVQK